jgi:hypothetical protein
MFAGGRSFRVVTRGDHVGIVEQHQFLLGLVRETIQHRTGADAGMSAKFLSAASPSCRREMSGASTTMIASASMARNTFDRASICRARLTPSRPERRHRTEACRRSNSS